MIADLVFFDPEVVLGSKKCDVIFLREGGERLAAQFRAFFGRENGDNFFFSFLSRWNCWLLPNHHQPLNRYPLGLREHLCGVAYARRANPRPEKKNIFHFKNFWDKIFKLIML